MQHLVRFCNKEYKIPDSHLIIKEGDGVLIPVYGLQHDEKYYEEPDEFKPDRFNEENSMGKSLVNRPFLPFGDGPRNCVGMRLGKMQGQVGLVLFLRKFKYELEDRLKSKPLQIETKSYLLAPQGGIKLYVSRR